jgi:hypothetical protein
MIRVPGRFSMKFQKSEIQLSSVLDARARLRACGNASVLASFSSSVRPLRHSRDRIFVSLSLMLRHLVELALQLVDLLSFFFVIFIHLYFEK